MKILYLGDNAGTSAEYLKAVLKELEHTVEHIESQMAMPELTNPSDVYLISDYPAQQLTESWAQYIINEVKSGKRLIMLGGWDSFNGRGINYSNHPIAAILPVRLQQEDDRVNASQGLFLEKDEALISNLPIDWSHPPIICGYNAVEAKETATVRVWSKPLAYDGVVVNLLERQPLIVSEKINQGIAIACTTDVAPHWCGGLVDWGTERRSLGAIEVGDMYINFIRLLLEIK